MIRIMFTPRHLIVSSAAVVALATLSACSNGSASTASRQALVEARGASVMPFDQKRTTHVFHSTSTGGVQSVVAKDREDIKQIVLVRAHLRKEASRFAVGDFSDPTAIHGMKMPGLDTLRHGAARVKVAYSTIASGAQISYSTAEPSLVSALHEWFDAQLMDHGSNAHG